MAPPPKTVRVCVVGAGPSGLSFLYYVNQIKESISSNIKNPENISVDVVCYEKHATFGGLWNLSWRVGKFTYYKKKMMRLNIITFKKISLFNHKFS